MKPFRIFRPGKHTASCGTQVEFTEADLKRAAEVYDQALYAAPLVIGHPKTEDRAYGWTGSLSYQDGYLVAHPDKVEPAFAELVEKGAYRNRSASWYMPSHPNNPSPGNLYPKHIGFLGAVPPALKGLGDVEFAAEEHPELVVEFASSDDGRWSLASVLGTMARLLRTMRDLRIEEKGLEDADRLLPAYVIEDAERAARDAIPSSSAIPQMGFSESTTQTTTGDTAMTLTPEQIAQLQSERDAAQARVAAFEERETRIAAAERLALTDSIDRQLEPHVRAGRVTPAMRPALVEFIAGLPEGDQAATIEFGEPAEAGGAKPKLSPRAFALQFIAKLPRAVQFGEIGATATGDGSQVTANQLAVKAREIKARVKKDEGREISFTEATNMAVAELGGTLSAPDAGSQDEPGDE